MKESKYNLFFKDKETSKYIIFNSRTTALASINEKEMDMYQNLRHKNFNYKTQDELNILDELKKGGFVVEDDVDEVGMLRYLQKNAQYSKESLSLTIAPTMACNFGCVYCYEGEHNACKVMGDEVKQKIVGLVESQIKNISSLGITWYGGEPLLARDIIEELSKKFIELCEKNNVFYSASIITNGYYLTVENAKKLNDLKVDMIQVTLDGTKEYHNKKRPLQNGKGTFDKILLNLIAIKEIFKDGISLRINTDINNKNDVKQVIYLLKKYNLLNDIYPYLGYVEPTNNFYESEKCLSAEEFFVIKQDFMNELSKYQDINLETQYPKVRLKNCLADSKLGLVIDPDGNITKCWCDIGHEEYTIGNLNQGIKKYNRLIDYFNYDVFSEPKCQNCNIIPLCLGGCPRRRIDKVAGICFITKNELYQRVIDMAKKQDNTIKTLEIYNIN